MEATILEAFLVEASLEEVFLVEEAGEEAEVVFLVVVPAAAGNKIKFEKKVH